ncbi:hypothetical protein ACVIHH_001397 [Bradyrhizobium sp. USDA 4518]
MAVHGSTMSHGPIIASRGCFRAVSHPLRTEIASTPSWLIIIKDLGVSGRLRIPRHFHWCTMRPVSALIACTLFVAPSFLVSSAALADSRVFIVANQADGYGIDQCLARGDRCGASAARAYCRSRDFAQATNYRRVDPDEITGAVPHAANEKCNGNSCGEFVAITCQR